MIRKKKKILQRGTRSNTDQRRVGARSLGSALNWDLFCINESSARRRKDVPLTQRLVCRTGDFVTLSRRRYL